MNAHSLRGGAVIAGERSRMTAQTHRTAPVARSDRFAARALERYRTVVRCADFGRCARAAIAAGGKG